MNSNSQTDCHLKVAHEIERNAEKLDHANLNEITDKLRCASSCVNHCTCGQTSYCTIAIAGLFSRIGRRS
ncbi:hypothetical protein CU669_11765 [Paramagnetospirillum kuznetsovii]|uniref:Uncharacterized protein n=1 Tax=Paramagnetospirillum kuznetsovii TaxID=2053833 RepID=A0A364NXE3_9PROT|nr:hypothetical protein CU669_11765 [Paramagnetospirillum kuznetsovii]